MDIDKYLSLLDRSALFFCRADKFSDPFEGSIPKIEADHRIKDAKNIANSFGRPFDEEKAWKNIEGIKNLHKRFKRSIVVNCWHINRNESDAMWRLYLKDNEGIAIQSTAARMISTIEKAEEKIELSKIRYLDYDNEGWYHPKDYPHISYNLLAPYMHKRLEFHYEQEYRLFYQIQEAINTEDFWDKEENYKGKFIKIDLRNLVETVYLSPTVDDKTKERIIAQTKDRGYDFSFLVSKLNSEPCY